MKNPCWVHFDWGPQRLMPDPLPRLPDLPADFGQPGQHTEAAETCSGRLHRHALTRHTWSESNVPFQEIQSHVDTALTAVGFQRENYRARK